MVTIAKIPIAPESDFLQDSTKKPIIKNHTVSPSDIESNQCLICLADNAIPIETDCQKCTIYMHQECYDAYAKQSSKCPICRNKVRSVDMDDYGPDTNDFITDHMSVIILSEMVKSMCSIHSLIVLLTLESTIFSMSCLYFLFFDSHDIIDKTLHIMEITNIIFVCIYLATIFIIGLFVTLIRPMPML